MGETGVVVLGKSVESPGIPPELRGRMDVALTAFDRIDAGSLVCTGGYTTPGVDVAESDVMRRYAIRNGVDPARIHVDRRARNTIENAYYTRLIVDDLPVSTVHVTTSCYHAERARFVFERVYGDGYDVVLDHCHPSNRSSAEIDEADALDAARTFFEPIAPGDLDAIADRLGEYGSIRA